SGSRRSAPHRDAHRARGQTLLEPSRRRSARARSRHTAGGRCRRSRFGCLDADDADRTPAGAAPAHDRIDTDRDGERRTARVARGRAIVQAVGAGEVVSGASTLTMQTARLLEPRPRTIASKLIEMARALQLEWRYDKREILAMYLTLAPYGGNIEGVRAASLFYFGREPEALTAGEAALLVALPQSPERLRPDRAPSAAARARERVLQIAADAGIVSV